jgi:hypothetical protein
MGWNWHLLQSQPQIVEASFEQITSAEILKEQLGIEHEFVPLPTVTPTVDHQRLWADLEALSFQRYTEGDRDHARDYISKALQEAGWSPKTQSFENGINIYAERPGTEPEAGTILLGAHYDTVEQSPGTDDNATAVAAVLEAARLFRQVPTPRTLQIVLFDLEEAGLLGSFAFADDNPTISNVKGAVILEMLGYACHTDGCQRYPRMLPITPPTTRGNFLAVIGDQGHMPLIDSFTQANQSNLPEIITLPVPLLGPFTPDLLRSDHAPFWRKGIGAVMVTDTANFRNPNYHQPSDSIETVDREFFTGATQLMVNALTSLLSSRGDLATATHSSDERIQSINEHPEATGI